LTHRAVTAALLWAGFPSAALKQTSVSNIKYILATCVADDGFVSHGTMLGESYQTVVQYAAYPSQSAAANDVGYGQTHLFRRPAAE
jgi:hypothetical protein